MDTKKNRELTDKVFEIDAWGEGLTPWEINFVAKIIDQGIYEFSPRQAEIIREIHERLEL